MKEFCVRFVRYRSVVAMHSCFLPKAPEKEAAAGESAAEEVEDDGQQDEELAAMQKRLAALG